MSIRRASIAWLCAIPPWRTKLSTATTTLYRASDGKRSAAASGSYRTSILLPDSPTHFQTRSRSSFVRPDHAADLGLEPRCQRSHTGGTPVVALLSTTRSVQSVEHPSPTELNLGAVAERREPVRSLVGSQMATRLCHHSSPIGLLPLSGAASKAVDMPATRTGHWRGETQSSETHVRARPGGASFSR